MAGAARARARAARRARASDGRDALLLEVASRARPSRRARSRCGRPGACRRAALADASSPLAAAAGRGARARRARSARAGAALAPPRRQRSKNVAARWLTRVEVVLGAARRVGLAALGVGAASRRPRCPARSASTRTASGNVRPSSFITKSTAPPLSLQPKQWKKPRSAFTWKLGVFSLWNGQSPTKSARAA